MFPHKEIHKQTWADARHGNNIMDVRSLRGIEGDTDHYLVRAKVKTRISSEKYNKTTRNPQWSLNEIENTEKQHEYKEQLEQTLNSEREHNDIEKM